ncbi:unnamed protein product [Rhodiola kirilowii]
MGSDSRPLRVFFFPFMAHGHLIPMVDIARLFSSQGVHSTIITTPLNANYISKTTSLSIKTLPFHAAEVGLPDGCENLDMLPSPDLIFKFFQAANLLQKSFENLLELEKPDCLISDIFFPWSVDSAEKFNIPRLVFNGTSFFAMCALESLKTHKPYKSVSTDSEPFVIPNLPDEIKMTKSQFTADAWEDAEKGIGKLLAEARASGLRSFGVVVNSFYELEPAYADYYKNVLNMKAWCVGPVSVCNRNVEEKIARGKKSTIDDHECLKWLEGKEPDSVVYVCFGSGASFPDEQLRDIALGLEDSGVNFIWVIRSSSESRSEDYLPEGFEDRVKDRGFVIRGWAPQVLILDHPSVGGFVTHCGWNSALEGISAGLPMVTWPLFAEQFFNQKLITDVLKLGVEVGVQKWSRNGEDRVPKEKVEKAVRDVMVGEVAEERRGRARQLGKLAKKAVAKDGSSYIDLHNLLDELKLRRETLS